MSTPITVAKYRIFVSHFCSPVRSNVGKNVSFVPQKYRLLFNMTIYYMKNDIEGKVTSHRFQNGGRHCFG